MITIKLKGGLGNQMFQYALGRKLAQKHGTTLALDVAFLNDRTPRKDVIFRNFDLDIFKLDPSVKIVNMPHYIDPVSKIAKLFFILKLKLDKNYIKEKYFQFDPAILDVPDGSYLDGQWTSEKYFSDIGDIIRREFLFKEALLPISEDLARVIASENSVCVNIRRADFVANKITATFHGVMDEEYFSKAMKIMENALTTAPHFFVFSDDIEWCKKNITSQFPVTFVDHSHKGVKFGNYLHLMTLCKHFIIPNSTFGWWAAWLSTSDPQKKVIAPKQWFADPKVDTRDVIPSTWTRL